MKEDWIFWYIGDGIFSIAGQNPARYIQYIPTLKKLWTRAVKDISKIDYQDFFKDLKKTPPEKIFLTNGLVTWNEYIGKRICNLQVQGEFFIIDKES